MCPKKVLNPPYQKSMLDAAIKAVTTGKFTTKEASTVYGVPMTAIGSNLRKRGTTRKMREPFNLTKVDEQIIEWLKLMSEMGCVSLKNQLCDIVNEVFERNGHKDKLTGRLQQTQWVERFSVRHPEVPEESLQAEFVSTGISSNHIEDWANKLGDCFSSTYNLEIENFSVEANASKIFTCFEIGSVFCTVNKTSSKLIYKPSQGQIEGEFMLSLYCCVCADGSFLKPIALVNEDTVLQVSLNTELKAFHILPTKDGRMNCEATMFWLQLIDVEIQPKRGDEPVILYLDQSVRPLSLATLDFCRQKRLRLFYLPGHYPNMKLPFGMDVFYNLNGEYDNILSSDDAKFNEINIDITINLLMESWKLMLNSNMPITEFLDFGLVPHDVQAMKSTVEAIVPITRSPDEQASEPQDTALTPGSSAHVPHTSNTSSASNVTVSSIQSPPPSTTPIAHRRTTRIPPKNYKEVSDNEDSNDEIVDQCQIINDVEKQSPPVFDTLKGKLNLKLKIKKSEHVPNNYSIEQDINDGNTGKMSKPVEVNEAFGNSNSVNSCDRCNLSLNDGLRTGVIQGLVFALKRIESSLRADTLNLFKARYLSPYLSDHRPTEPSFVMWCELMKCLEMGPDAVHQDFLLARTIQEKALANQTKQFYTSSGNSANIYNETNSSVTTSQPTHVANSGETTQNFPSNKLVIDNHTSQHHSSNDCSVNSSVAGDLKNNFQRENVSEHFRQYMQPPYQIQNFPSHSAAGSNRRVQGNFHNPSTVDEPDQRQQSAHLSKNSTIPLNSAPRDKCLIQKSEDRKLPLSLYQHDMRKAENQFVNQNSQTYDVQGVSNTCLAIPPGHLQNQPGRQTYPVLHEQSRALPPLPNQSSMLSKGIPNHSRNSVTELSTNYNQLVHREQIGKDYTKDNSASCQIEPGYSAYHIRQVPQNVHIPVIDNQESCEDYSFQPPNSLMKNNMSTPKSSIKHQSKPQTTPALQKYCSSKAYTHDSSSEYHFSDIPMNSANVNRYPPTNNQSFISNHMSVMQSTLPNRRIHSNSNPQTVSNDISRESCHPENMVDSHHIETNRQTRLQPHQGYMSVHQTGENISGSYVSHGSYGEFASENVPSQMNVTFNPTSSQSDQPKRVYQVSHNPNAFQSPQTGYQPHYSYVQPMQPILGSSHSTAAIASGSGTSMSASDGNHTTHPELRLKSENFTNL